VETAKGKTREELISILTGRIDNFERYTQPHSQLMEVLAVRLARRLGLAPPDIAAIREAALLHDIGLYAMAPTYCSRPGPLSFDEQLDLWRHPIIGEQQMSKREASRLTQLLVRWHHEWWNGSGYPDSLAFEDIPIGARILRVVELYSALISDRPYRDALNPGEVISKLKAAAGVECDPYVVLAFVSLVEEVRNTHVPNVSEPLPLRSIDAPAPATAFHPIDSDAHSITIPETAGGSSAGQTAGQTSGPQYFEPFLGPSELGIETSESQVVATNETTESVVAETQAQELPVAEVVQVYKEEERKAPAPSESSKLPAIQVLISRAGSDSWNVTETGSWGAWRPSRYNRKSLLGFEVSVLRQIEFRSIASAYIGGTRLDWYIKSWRKQIISNDPRSWAAVVSKATIEAREPLGEEHISRLLQDVYVPGSRLTNSHLRRWFSETDAWWMDNLRRSIGEIEDETLCAQALALGLQTGDYALSFEDETRDLRRPLTTVFWQLAGRAFAGAPNHPQNRSHQEPVRDFILRANADLLYLNLPPGHGEEAGSEARSTWRECWLTGQNGQASDDLLRLTSIPQSKQAYLAAVDRLLRAASHLKIWAIGYQETGLASARDISELIKEHRPISTTYSKDLTEVAGGLHSYILVARI
jgi:hypothetical protein